MPKFTKDEKSLLLFLECAAVDYGGLFDARHTNSDDFKIMHEWAANGFIQFGRVAFHDIGTGNRSHWVVLSEAAWIEAHKERRSRNVRREQALEVERIGYSALFIS